MEILMHEDSIFTLIVMLSLVCFSVKGLGYLFPVNWASCVAIASLSL